MTTSRGAIALQRFVGFEKIEWRDVSDFDVSADVDGELGASK